MPTGKNRPSWRLPQNVHRQPNAEFRCQRSQFGDGHPSRRQCNAMARTTGQRCRKDALQGAAACRVPWRTPASLSERASGLLCGKQGLFGDEEGAGFARCGRSAIRLARPGSVAGRSWVGDRGDAQSPVRIDGGEFRGIVLLARAASPRRADPRNPYLELRASSCATETCLAWLEAVRRRGCPTYQPANLLISLGFVDRQWGRPHFYPHFYRG